MCSSTQNPSLFIQWLKKEVKPALGCTEPVAIAFAAAYAAQHLDEEVEKITGSISANLFKNAMGVTIPGTDCCGVNMAAAIGAVGGDAQRGLETLKGITAAHLEQARQLLPDVSIQASDTKDFIDIDLTACGKQNHCRVVVRGAHTHVVSVSLNGKELAAGKSTDNTVSEATLAPFSLKEAFDYINQAPFEDIAFILEAARLNRALSDEGKRRRYGLNINQVLSGAIDAGLADNSLMNRILIDTVAASDARMGGASVPAMSNFGSGNQGIAATMPVVVLADALNASEEELARALALSHLSAISIHSRYTRLSALCAATTASMGAASGMAWLFTKDFKAVSHAVTNMISDVTGIICDGASNSCAMKVSTATLSAFKAVLMARENCYADSHDGIVGPDVEDSISHLCRLVIHPMTFTDKEIINIMMSK